MNFLLPPIVSRALKLLGGAACALALLRGGMAQAQNYPTHPITLLVGGAAGDAQDDLARLIAPRLGAALGGATVVVENRPGSDGTIALSDVAHGKPDGYTLGLAQLASLILTPDTLQSAPYNSLTDFEGVSTVAATPFLYTVRPDLPIKNFADMVKYAKTNPGKMSFLTAGPNGVGRVMLELVKMTTKINVRFIPYKSTPQGMVDLLAGRLDGAGLNFPFLYPQAKAGKLRALATTGAQRSALLPDVPTMAELGYPALQQSNWFMVVAPPKTPDAIVVKLNAALRQVSTSPDTQKALQGMGLDAMTQPTPTATAAFLKDQSDRWGKVIKAAGIGATK